MTDQPDDNFTKYRLRRKESEISHPLKSQVLTRHGNKHLKIASAIMQGLRMEMEDGHSLFLSLKDHPQTAYFGLFDGHNGSKASEWCKDNFHRYLDKIDEPYTLEKITSIVLEADKDFLNTGVTDGSTAVFALINRIEKKKDKFRLTVGNVGDSRCILIHDLGKGGFELKTLTKDHKPVDKLETERIEKAGGIVARGRVDGILAVSRSLGDCGYKERTDLPPEQQRVTSVPDIMTLEVGKNDYVLLCCDGVFEGLSDTEVGSFLIRDLEKNSGDVAVTLSKLLFLALEKKSKDNLSAILILFKNGEDYNKEDEFLPGEYPTDPNSTFAASYKKFSEVFGKNLKLSGSIDPKDDKKKKHFWV